jgi:tRNA1(Val) A37 N6-methylase TrmN6
VNSDGDRDALGPITQDCLLGGKLQLRQPAKGHRAGTDAILLAAAAGEAGSGLIVDVGAGVGTAGLAVALREPAARVALVENDAPIAALARENLAVNGLADRGFVAEADVTLPRQRRAAGLVDGEARLVLTNPPFFAPGRVRVSPIAARGRAHVMAEPEGDPIAPLTRWLRAALALLAPAGTFVAIHRPEVIGELIAAVDGRLGDLRLLPIHPRSGAAAIRVLLIGTKGSRAPLRLLQGFALHQDDGTFTPLAEAVHRGEALLVETSPRGPVQ